MTPPISMKLNSEEKKGGGVSQFLKIDDYTKLLKPMKTYIGEEDN